MATAGRTLSPGGALLRASRVFSLPSSLPPPPGDYNAATSYNSETATKAFPTLQTVTVPEAFRQHGDWGFKRNFPLKSTAKTSTPYLRVNQVDSIEHVTDFTSAADHTLTLEKWQEMNIAISLPHALSSGSHYIGRQLDNALESVFEDKYDFTAIDSEKINAAGQRRWKYKGPWLANLTEGEFQTYLKREVRGRRAEFRQFLREQLAPGLTQEAKRRAMEKGENVEVAEVRPEDVTDEHILDFLRLAREYRTKLYDLIGKFLDLAPIEPPPIAGVVEHLGNLAPNESKQIESANPYAKYGPPVTHPSAGLSYLRTSSFLENHPVYGPQGKHRAIKGRVMSVNGGNGSKIGLGGIISPSAISSTQYKSTGMDRVDFKSEGGSKMWVTVTSAQVDSKGRAIINVAEAGTEERMIQEEMQGERQLFHAEAEVRSPRDTLQLRTPGSSRILRQRPSVWNTGSPKTYGTDWGRSEKAPR